MANFDRDVQRAVPSTFYMISSSSDTQQSEETYNTSNFELPNPAGKAGGACTSAFLQQQYEGKKGMSWVETLKQMRSVLKGMGYNQTPTLSSSRTIQPTSPMTIVPPQSGRRRALLIGINYVGQKGELTACHNDCSNIREYLINVHGFREDEMLVLMDDGVHQEPTKQNIENGMILLTKYSQPGDVVFVSFSGHGGRVEDRSGDEEDGFDETIMPVDFMQNGQIVDDDILNMLVKPMKAGVTATVLMDCCHSGSVLDLPYVFGSDDRHMKREEKFDMSVVKTGVRKEIVSEKEWVEKKNLRKKESKEIQKKAQKRAEREEEKRMCGPKLAPNGQPVLPSRPAPAKPPPPPTRKERPVPKAKPQAKPRGESKQNSNTQPSSPTRSNGGPTTVENDSPQKQSHKFKMPNQNRKPVKQEQSPEGINQSSDDHPSSPTKSNDATATKEPQKQSHKFKMPNQNKKPVKQEQAPEGINQSSDDHPSSPTKSNDVTATKEENDSPPKQQAHKFKMPKKNKKPIKEQEQAPDGATAEDDGDDPKKCVIM